MSREFIETKCYYEDIIQPETEEFQSGRCKVYADDRGRFITVETDSYEGCALMTLPLAVKVHKALGRAIKAAQQARAKAAHSENRK